MRDIIAHMKVLVNIIMCTILGYTFLMLQPQIPFFGKRKETPPATPVSSIQRPRVFDGFNFDSKNFASVLESIERGNENMDSSFFNEMINIIKNQDLLISKKIINPFDLMKVLCLASTIFTANIDNSLADQTTTKITRGINQENLDKFMGDLDKTFTSLKKINQAEYINFLTQEKGTVPNVYVFSETDKRILAWNIYHECRGEVDSGKLGVILSVLNRMSSNKYPKSLGGVVFKKFAFSWALAIKKLGLIVETNNEIDATRDFERQSLPLEKINEADFNVIFDFINKLTTTKRSLGELKQEVEIRLMAMRDTKENFIPDSFNFGKVLSYHKYGMLFEKNFLAEIKTIDTFRRVAYIETLFESRDPKVSKLGNQLYYSDELQPDEKWELPSKYKAQLLHTKIKKQN